jgi:hypothetical protein
MDRPAHTVPIIERRAVIDLANLPDAEILDLWVRNLNGALRRLTYGGPMVHGRHRTKIVTAYSADRDGLSIKISGPAAAASAVVNRFVRRVRR